MDKCPQCGKPLPDDSHTCPECGLTIPQTDYTSISDETLPGERPSVQDEALKPGRVLGGRYEILETIGRGGMGWVYKARDREIDRVVALKIIRQDLAKDETVIQRFKDEIILARKVTHKHVLRIFDIAEADGFKFISMPFIEGKDLKAIITEGGRLDLEETLRIARQVLEALKSAHEAGVIHRDLKPQNIMIDRDGNAYVTDFGIAKSAEAGGLTVTGQIVGTPEYMSPEQAEGKEVDYRTDVYSFGLVLYEMLTGDVPFKGDSIISTLMLRLRERPEAPSRGVPTVPQWLDRLVMRALERDLEDRYNTVDEILVDIERQTVRPRRKLRSRTLVLFVSIAAVGIAAALFLVFRKPTLVFQQERTYIAVLPFQNVTDDPSLEWLSSGIPDNLTADLAQSKFFRVMSLERLRQVVHEIGKGLSEVTTPEAMNQLAKATDLDAITMGSFIKSGENITITMKIESAEGLEIIGTGKVEGTEGDLLDMIDELTTHTKQIFNLSQKEIDEDLDRAVGLQRTRSVRAASEFSKGLEHSYSSAYLDAVQAFEAAIEADPDFAMAYAKASEAYKNLGYDAKAESLSFLAFDKVIKFTDRVPLSDRTFILANHANITHNADQAIESYTEFVDAYPDNPEGYFKLGLAYEDKSEWDPAAENLKRALELDPKFGSARFELAKVLIRKEDIDTALMELERTLAHYEDIGNREGEATVLNAMGVVYRHKSDFERAIDYFEASIRIKEDLGDKRGIAASLGNLGLVYRLMGRRDEAVAVLERSLEIKRAIGDKLGMSIALNKIGQMYMYDGEYDNALSHFERSYEIRKEIGAKHLIAASLSDMAFVYSLMGRYKKAVEMDSTALVLRSEIGDARGEAQSLRSIAEMLTYRGAFEEARDYLKRAMSINRALGDARLIASDRHWRGNYFLTMGEADSAIAYLASALEDLENLEQMPDVAAILASLGEAYLLKGDFKRSLENLTTAIKVATDVEKKELIASARLAKARVFREIGHHAGLDSVLSDLQSYDEKTLSHHTRCDLRLEGAKQSYAKGNYTEALRLEEEVTLAVGNDDVRCRARALILAAVIALDQDDLDRARERYETALDESRRYGLSDIEAKTLWSIARMDLEEGRLEHAESRSEEALRIATRLGLSRYEYMVACGDIALAAGKSEEALDHYRNALDEAREILADRCPPRLRSHYLESARVAGYIDKVTGLLEQAGRSEEADRYSTIFGLK